MESDLSSALANIQASCKHDIVDQMMHVEQHYQLCDLKSVEWARNLSCLRRLSRKRRRGYSSEDEGAGDWSFNTLGRGTTNGHSDYIAVSYPWKAATSTALCDPATQLTTASTNVDSAAAGGWKIAALGNARRTARSKVRDGVLRRAIAYAEMHGTELIWIDRECVPQDEDAAVERRQESTHLHETAMQSMDLVYRWAKHPIALIFESVGCQEEVGLLEALLRGSVVEVKGFDGNFAGPSAADTERPRDGGNGRRAKSKGERKSKAKEASTDDDSDDEDSDPSTDHPRFVSSVSPSTISRLLALLTRLTSDPWFSRAWIFQENYCAGAKMRLLIPHSRSISKAHAVDLFGNIPHELNVRSIAFFNAATKFCLAYLADPRYVGSTQGKAQCEAIIHRAGRYNLLHRYGFVSEIGSTSPTEIALQAEAKEQRRRLQRHRHRSKGHGNERERERERKTQHTSRPFSRAMSTTIFADLAARRITQPHDILAIAANCCAYDTRLDTKALRSAGTVAKAAATFAGTVLEGKKGRGKRVAMDEVYQSLSAAVLALWFLNGEVFKNMLPPPPEPQVPSEYPDITIPPVEDGQVVGEDVEEPPRGETDRPASNTSNASNENNDFDTSDAPLSLTLSTSLSGQQCPSQFPLPPNTSIPPTPTTTLTALSFLSRTALDSFIPPSPTSSSFRAGPLTFLKSCRFRCVQLTRTGVATRGYLWMLDERISTKEWNAPVARVSEGGRFWRRRKSKIDPLALLAAEIRGRAKGGHDGDSGARFTWLARRLEAMVAVRAVARRAAEEKRERRKAKKMGLRMESGKSKSGAAAAAVVGNSKAKAKTPAAKRQQKVDEATLARLRDSVTTFDHCMADAVGEAVRDGRDLILARAWDGREDPAANAGQGEGNGRKKGRKKVYRAIFVWDETPQGEDGGEGGVASSSDAEDSDGEEVDEEASGNGTTQVPTKSAREERHGMATRGGETNETTTADHRTNTTSLSTSTSTTDIDSDTPLCRLPSRTKAKIQQSVAQSSRPSSSSSSSSSLTSLTSSSSSDCAPTSETTFAPTLAFTSHTPPNTRYRFNRRAALEESHIDKFVSLEVALDAACASTHPTGAGGSGREKDVGEDVAAQEDEEESGKTRGMRGSRRARPTSQSGGRRQKEASAVDDVTAKPAPPLLRTKRWINGLAFLPSPPPSGPTGSTRGQGSNTSASKPKSKPQIAPRATGTSAHKATAQRNSIGTAGKSARSNRVNVKVKVGVRGKEKAKAHMDATRRVLRARGYRLDAARQDEKGDEKGDEEWEEEGQGEQGEQWDGDGADEYEYGDGDGEVDWQTGERPVVFAWPEGLARK